MNKLIYTIPICLITFVINITVIFEIFGERMFIEYFFYIFISASISVLTFNLILVSSGLVLWFFSLIQGVGILIYTYPFFLDTILPGLFFCIELTFLIAMQKEHDLFAKPDENKLQKVAKASATNEQDVIIQAYKEGLKNKDICKKYDFKPWTVTRAIQKFKENES
jgi:hypothetical protein